MFDLEKLLEGVQTIGISGHINPDGDCVGACLGLYLYLKTYHPSLQTAVHLEKLPEDLAFLAGSDEIIFAADPETVYDLFFCLDCSDPERLGANQILYDRARQRVCVDHHVTGHPRAEVCLVDPGASSTSELIADLLGTEKLSGQMAEALYTGIIHDTGVFQYSCTSSHTMVLAGQLMDKGIDFSRIVEESFFAKTYLQTQIMGRALLESIMLLDNRVVFSALKQKDLDFYGVDPSDLGGIVSQLRSIRGVDVAIFLYEKGVQEWKVSMRSTDRVDVARIAAYFGGGGHKKAAGCTMQGSVYDVVNNLTAHMERQLIAWDKEHAED